MIKPVIGRKLLIVEDNTGLRVKTKDYFASRGNEVVDVSTLQEAQATLAQQTFDAIILDLILPDGEGLELFSIPSLPPVIIMTTLSGEYDMLEGFSSGAADYVVKPCPMPVLEARLALRLLPSSEAKLIVSGLVLDASARRVFYGDRQIILTGTEFNILKFLMEHAGTFFRTDEIYEHIWREPSFRSTAIRYHVSNLRQKLLAATERNLIIAEYGKGYCFITGEKS